MRIPLAAPLLGTEEFEAISAVLRSGQLVQGRKVAEFEAACAKVLNVSHAVAVSSGTAALHLALLAAGVGPGDRVAVPTFSWPATANVVVLVGAEPVFVDIDPQTFCMDPDELDLQLREQAVRAVLPVHAFGGMADMRRLCAVAEEHGCVVVEDAACAIGATLDGLDAGSWGALGCFSFHPRKTVTTGEGGLVVTRSAVAADRLRTLRNHGLDPTGIAPDFVEAGLNYRLTEMQAALGTVQLARLDGLLEERRCQAGRYDAFLQGTDISVPVATGGSRHSYQSYVVLLPPDLADQQREVIAEVRSFGIEVTIGTYHIPLTTLFRRRGGYAEGRFPCTDDVANRAVTIPLFPGLTAQQQEEVVEVLISVVDRRRPRARR